PAGPENDADARQSGSGADVSAGGSQPGRVLSFSSRAPSGRGGHGGAFGHPADRVGTSSSLWLPSHHGRVAPSRFPSQPQARGAADAHRQPAGGAAESVHRHHRLAPRSGGLPESGREDEAEWNQSAL